MATATKAQLVALLAEKDRYISSLQSQVAELSAGWNKCSDELTEAYDTQYVSDSIISEYRHTTKELRSAYEGYALPELQHMRSAYDALKAECELLQSSMRVSEKTVQDGVTMIAGLCGVIHQLDCDLRSEVQMREASEIAYNSASDSAANYLAQRDEIAGLWACERRNNMQLEAIVYGDRVNQGAATEAQANQGAALSYLADDLTLIASVDPNQGTARANQGAATVAQANQGEIMSIWYLADDLTPIVRVDPNQGTAQANQGTAQANQGTAQVNQGAAQANQGAATVARKGRAYKYMQPYCVYDAVSARKPRRSRFGSSLVQFAADWDLMAERAYFDHLPF